MASVEEFDIIKKSGKVLLLTSSFFGISILYLIYIVGLLQGRCFGIASGIEIGFFLTGSAILFGSNHGFKKAKRSLFWATFFTGFFLFANIFIIIGEKNFSIGFLTLVLLIYLFTKQIQTFKAIKGLDIKNLGEKRSFFKSFPPYAYGVVISYITLYAGGFYLIFRRAINS